MHIVHDYLGCSNCKNCIVSRVPAEMHDAHLRLPNVLIVLPAKSTILPVLLSMHPLARRLPCLIFFPKLATIFKVILFFLGMLILYFVSVLMPASL
jgi:hypothetical protein